MSGGICGATTRVRPYEWGDHKGAPLPHSTWREKQAPDLCPPGRDPALAVCAAYCPYGVVSVSQVSTFWLGAYTQPVLVTLVTQNWYVPFVLVTLNETAPLLLDRAC